MEAPSVPNVPPVPPPPQETFQDPVPEPPIPPVTELQGSVTDRMANAPAQKPYRTVAEGIAAAHQGSAAKDILEKPPEALGERVVEAPVSLAEQAILNAQDPTYANKQRNTCLIVLFVFLIFGALLVALFMMGK